MSDSIKFTKNKKTNDISKKEEKVLKLEVNYNELTLDEDFIKKLREYIKIAN